MEWLTSHWRAVTGTGIVGALLYLLQRRGIIGVVITRLYSVPRAIHQTDAQLISGQTQLLTLRTTERDQAKQECSQLEAENAQLARDLKEETRKVLLREQINSEDTQYIRAVTRRLREKGIDYSDINAEFARND